jgi:Tol biopolymer transport system component
VVALCLASGTGAATVPEGPRLTVSRVTFEPFRFDLETVDQRGALPVRLIGGSSERERPLPEPFVQPAWSPDGSRIVFAGSSGKTRLYVADADGGEMRPLAGSSNPDEPVFTPDGDSVAFARYQFRLRAHPRGRERFVITGASIWIVRLADGALRRLTPKRKGVYMYPESFSADGGTLLVSRTVGTRPWEVVRMTVATRKTEVLLHRADNPIFSPDASRIVFTRWLSRRAPDGTLETSSHIFTIRAGGGGLRQLTQGRGNDRFPSWDPSGERLAYVRYLPEGFGELAELGFGSAVIEVNADGTCPRAILPASPLTAFFGTVWQPGPGREASRIAC